MLRAIAAALLLCLLAAAQDVAPAGITCCREESIRLAMTEEALQRIVARHKLGAGAAGDYLSAGAYEKIRRRLPPGGCEQLLDFLRATLLQPQADADTREFQRQVGHFVLGMTLEIGHTFQGEFDLLQKDKEKIDRLIARLEDATSPGDHSLDAALFHADLSEKDLRRIRTLDLKWKDADAGASPFDEFGALKKNASGRAADPDQRMVFELAGRYRAAFPFLDEFLENYRRLAAEIREACRRVNVLLSASGT
jgi:hypothetical protein